jgi:hypothetical protein
LARAAGVTGRLKCGVGRSEEGAVGERVERGDELRPLEEAEERGVVGVGREDVDERACRRPYRWRIAFQRRRGREQQGQLLKLLVEGGRVGRESGERGQHCREQPGEAHLLLGTASGT